MDDKNQQSEDTMISSSEPKVGNEALMRQVVELQQQLVDQQQKGLDYRSEKSVNKYAVVLFVLAGLCLLSFFWSVTAQFLWRGFGGGGEFLLHDHLLLPMAAILMIVAGVQLMTKRKMGNQMVAIALGIWTLWNIVAAIHGYIELANWSGHPLSRPTASAALVLAIIRIIIYGLIVLALALWFYKSKSIRETIAKWVR